MNLKSWNPFTREDKFLLQVNMTVGDGFNSGLSVNLPLTTDIVSLHETADRMRRVLDRQRAISELPVFAEKLSVLEAQVEATEKSILELQAESDKEEAEKGAPKSSTTNALKMNQDNLERFKAEVEIGAARVENLKKRAAITEQTIDDVRELNRLGVAA